MTLSKDQFEIDLEQYEEQFLRGDLSEANFKSILTSREFAFTEREAESELNHIKADAGWIIDEPPIPEGEGVK